LFTSNSDEAADDGDLARIPYERLSGGLSRSSPIAEPMSSAE